MRENRVLAYGELILLGSSMSMEIWVKCSTRVLVYSHMRWWKRREEKRYPHTSIHARIQAQCIFMLQWRMNSVCGMRWKENNMKLPIERNEVKKEKKKATTASTKIRIRWAKHRKREMTIWENDRRLRTDTRIGRRSEISKKKNVCDVCIRF